MKEIEKENETLLSKIVDILGGKIKEVKINSTLGESAVTISAKGEISLEMEKTLGEIPGNEAVKAEKVLELNPEHPIFKKLQSSNDEEIKKLVEILYTQGMIIEGFPIVNPIEFVNKVNSFIK